MAKQAVPRRVKVTLTLPGELTEWIDEKVKQREFATRSHAVEVALIEFRRNEGKSKSHGGKKE